MVADTGDVLELVTPPLPTGRTAATAANWLAHNHYRLTDPTQHKEWRPTRRAAWWAG